MTKDQFFALPLVLQVRLIFNAFDEATSRSLLAQEAPKVPLSPKYDLAIYRSGGNSWASEHSLEGLLWWRKRYQAGVDGGGQYCEQDRKRVANIDKWIAWRELFPSECWSGTRNEDQVVAKPPSTKPIVYPRQGGPRPAPQQQQQPDVDPENFQF